MQAETRKIAFIVLFLAAFLTLHIYIKQQTKPTSEFRGAKVGDSAQSFVGTTLDNQKFDLFAAASSRKMIIINFWESWCGPCKIEMPDLQKIYDLHKGHGLEIVAVYQASSPGSVKEIIENLKLSFPIIYDQDGSISKGFGVQAVPTTITTDNKLKVLRSHQGIDFGLKAFVDSYLASAKK